jgi:hypothetical protein
LTQQGTIFTDNIRMALARSERPVDTEAGRGALGLAYLRSELKAQSTSYPVDKTRAHLADILAKYGDVENARWDTGFDNMMTWALHWVAKDGKQLAEAGEPVAEVEPFRRRVFEYGSRSDSLIKLSAWKALLADPAQVPTPEELQTAKASDPNAYLGLRARLWAAYQLINPLRLAGVFEFDELTKDLGTGPYARYFKTEAGKALVDRIYEAYKVTDCYRWEGEAVWAAMRAQQDVWSRMTTAAEAAATAATGAQAYGASSSSPASTSSTGGRTPPGVAVRLAAQKR